MEQGIVSRVSGIADVEQGIVVRTSGIADVEQGIVFEGLEKASLCRKCQKLNDDFKAAVNDAMEKI